MRGQGAAALPSPQGATWDGTTVPPAPLRQASRALGFLFCGIFKPTFAPIRPESPPHRRT
jgi:hypothetical protein